MIETFVDENKLYTDLANLKLWDKNPRSIKGEDFERLKRQILKLGQYKPNLVINDGTVLGGNMRTRAYNEVVKEYDSEGASRVAQKYNLSVTQVEESIAQIKKGIWISIVNPKTEDEKMEYALSDNDRAGFYDDDLLANIVPEYDDVDWGDYAIDLHAPVRLDETLYTDEGLSDAFELPDGEKGDFQQMAFVLADKQAEIIRKAIEVAKDHPEYNQIHKMGNENSNGNAIYLIVRQWLKNNSTS